MGPVPCFLGSADVRPRIRSMRPPADHSLSSIRTVASHRALLYNKSVGQGVPARAVTLSFICLGIKEYALTSRHTWPRQQHHLPATDPGAAIVAASAHVSYDTAWYSARGHRLGRPPDEPRVHSDSTSRQQPQGLQQWTSTFKSSSVATDTEGSTGSRPGRRDRSTSSPTRASADWVLFGPIRIRPTGWRMPGGKLGPFSANGERSLKDYPVAG